MANYINRDAVLVKIWKCESISQEAEDELVKAINSIPSPDVRPEVKARWKPRDLTYGRQYYYCTSCEETVDMPTAMGIPLFSYCPNCGAYMKGEANEE